jgi:lipid A 4'-phosphatase
VKLDSLLRLLLRYDTIVFLACIVFFLFWPDYDLSISQYFYDGGSGKFIGTYYIIFDYIQDLTSIIATTLSITLISIVAFCWLLKKDFLGQRWRIFVFLLTSFILGPGIMVNLVLKENWGRPRPRQVIEFGGSNDYRSPFDPSFDRKSGSSFVCGDASVGYFFFSLALLLRKRKWLWLSIIAGTVIGFGRVVQGAHYFSDVLFSGWVVWFCSLILYTLFFEYEFDQQMSQKTPPRRPALS